MTRVDWLMAGGAVVVVVVAIECYSRWHLRREMKPTSELDERLSRVDDELRRDGL